MYTLHIAHAKRAGCKIVPKETEWDAHCNESRQNMKEKWSVNIHRKIYFTLSIYAMGWNGMGCKTRLASNIQQRLWKMKFEIEPSKRTTETRTKRGKQKQRREDSKKKKPNQQQEKANQQRNNIQFRKANNYMIISVQPTSLFLDQNCLWLLDCQCPVNVIVLLKFMVSKTVKKWTNERTYEENYNVFHEEIASHTFSFQILIFEIYSLVQCFISSSLSPCSIRFGSWIFTYFYFRIQWEDSLHFAYFAFWLWLRFFFYCPRRIILKLNKS